MDDSELLAKLDALAFCVARLAVEVGKSGALSKLMKEAMPTSSPAVQAELERLQSVVAAADSAWHAKELELMTGGVQGPR